VEIVFVFIGCCVLLIGGLVGIYIWQQPPENRKKEAKHVAIAFGLIASAVIVFAIWAFVEDKREHQKFANMSDSEHLFAAREAYADNLLDQAELHLDAIKKPDSMKHQIDEVRGEVAQARDRQREQKARELEQQAKQRELKQKEEDKPDLIDSLPLTEHRKKMVINSGRWYTGEYHVCEIPVSENPTILMCPDLPSANATTRMDVVFYGSMENPRWDCKRREDDIYCEPKTD
jgi:hypothetical protein